MLVFVTMQSSVRAEHWFRTGFEEYIHNVAIPEHEHVAEADGFQLAGSAHMKRLASQMPGVRVAPGATPIEDGKICLEC